MAAKKEITKVLFGVHTERGARRPHNTDASGKFPADNNTISGNKGQLFIVADAKLRNPIGKNASDIVIEAIEKNYFAYPSDDAAFSLQRAFDIANRTLYQYAVASGMYRKIGATCTALALTDRAAYLAHIGDCRAYRVNLRRVEQLTTDHVRWVDHSSGKRPALTRAMGIKLGSKPDLGKFPLQRDEYFVLASDGLNVIHPTEIQGIVLSSSPERAAEKLVEITRARGGDDVTVQVIKVYQFNESTHPTPVSGVETMTSRWSNWPVYFMLTLLTSTMAFLVHEPFMQQATALVTLQRSPAKQEFQPPLIDPRVLEEQQLLRARDYFNKGQWDDALKEYRAVLRNNPQSSEALDGIDMISRAFTVRGDRSYNQDNLGAALSYYKQALRLNPDNANLRKLVVRTEKTLFSRQEQTALASAPQTLQFRDAELPFSPESTLKTLNIIGFAEDQWELAGLDDPGDFVMNGDKLTFADNLRIKKAFHQSRYQGVEVEVQARRLRGSRNGKFGLIFGHEPESTSHDNRFFLFTVDSNGNYSLQRVSRYSVKILISEAIKPGIVGNYDQIHLKIKNSGKLILLYANGVLLKMLPLSVEQNGGVGLYTDPKMQVEFSNFRIIPTAYQE